MSAAGNGSAYPESVLPGTLEQLDHLERISLLQNDRDSPPLPSSSSCVSCTVTLELWSGEYLRLVTAAKKKKITVVLKQAETKRPTCKTVFERRNSNVLPSLLAASQKPHQPKGKCAMHAGESTRLSCWTHTAIT